MLSNLQIDVVCHLSNRQPNLYYRFEVNHGDFVVLECVAVDRQCKVNAETIFWNCLSLIQLLTEFAVRVLTIETVFTYLLPTYWPRIISLAANTVSYQNFLYKQTNIESRYLIKSWVNATY